MEKYKFNNMARIKRIDEMSSDYEKMSIVYMNMRLCNISQKED